MWTRADRDETGSDERGMGRLVVLAVVAIVLGLMSSGVQAGDGGEESGEEAVTVSMQRASLELEAQVVDRELTSLRPESSRFRWTEETFVYSCRINGAEAMRAALQTGEIRENDGKPYVPVALDARSVGFFHNLYPVDDRADTFMDPRDFRPHRSEKYFHENGKRRSYVVTYAHGAHRAAVEKRKPKGRHEFNKPIPATTHDMLSWLYELRSRELTTGERFEYYIYDGWKVTHLVLRVEGEERLYTPAGWFNTWKLSYDRHIVETAKRTKSKDGGESKDPVEISRKTTSEHSGHLWLSRDENHLPLRLTIGTSYGLGEVVLLKYDSHTE